MRVRKVIPRLTLVALALAAGPLHAGEPVADLTGLALELEPLGTLPSEKWTATVPSAPQVDRVRFEVDGRAAQTDRFAPYRATLKLSPPLTRPIWIEAVALDREGRELWRDGRCVHLPGDRSLLRLSVPAPGEGLVLVQPVRQRRTVGVDGLAPDGSVFATVASPPYRLRLPLAGAWGARARFDDGTSTLAWHPGAGGGEVVDVRLGQARWLSPAEDSAPRAESVHVLFRGEEQPVLRVVGGERATLELGLAIDVSESTGPRFDELRSAARELASSLLGPADRSFLVTFSQNAELVASSRGDLGWVLSAVPSQVRVDKTRLYEGIAYALLQFHAEDPRAALIVLTDGCDTSDRPEEKRALELARARAIPVYALRIDVGCFRLVHTQDMFGRIRNNLVTDEGHTRVNRSRLERFAAASGGSVVPLGADDSVAEALRRIRAELDRQWTVVFEPTSAEVSSGAVELRVDAARHTQ